MAAREKCHRCAARRAPKSSARVVFPAPPVLALPQQITGTGARQPGRAIRRAVTPRTRRRRAPAGAPASRLAAQNSGARMGKVQQRRRRPRRAARRRRRRRRAGLPHGIGAGGVGQQGRHPGRQRGGVRNLRQRPGRARAWSRVHENCRYAGRRPPVGRGGPAPTDSARPRPPALADETPDRQAGRTGQAHPWCRRSTIRPSRRVLAEPARGSAPDRQARQRWRRRARGGGARRW